ncbi:MAG: phytanoyl-CoA dioxygenase family protein [Halieaceae bacterium]|nr:phytanoyl-CoA dioxygenase family protein [Halieaceae bacterium]
MSTNVDTPGYRSTSLHDGYRTRKSTNPKRVDNSNDIDSIVAKPTVTDATKKNPEQHEFNTYKDQDLANKYKQTHSSASKSLPADVVKADLHSVATQGYVIIENLVSVAEVQKVKSACNDLLDHTGRNDFEGLKTQRVYAVLSKTRAIDRLVDHPRILALLDNLLMPNYLLSQAQIITILPDETAQSLHTDDEFYPGRRPRKGLRRGYHVGY